MKILITGGNGQLAKSFRQAANGHELFLFGKNDLDVTDEKSVFNNFLKIKPDLVLHLASFTRREECAKNPKKANKINVSGTRNVVEACKKYNFTLVFVSTNEVFNGKKKLPYLENDKVNPITTVGETKYEAEEIIKRNLTKYFIVRTMWLYSQWTQNFLQIVLKIAKKNKKIKLVKNEFGSPTSSYDLAFALIKLIKTNSYGTYHITNGGCASRVNFAKYAFSILKMNNIKIEKVLLKNFPSLEFPPKYSSLESQKLEKIGIKMRPWKDALKEFLKKYYR